MRFFIGLIVIFSIMSCNHENIIQSHPWKVVELALRIDQTMNNPYTDLNLYVEFTDENGKIISRPAFWDGANIWKVRFVPPGESQVWKVVWKNDSSLTIAENPTTIQVNPLNKDDEIYPSLLKMSKGKRSVVTHRNKPFLIVGDTPWAMPFRATIDQVRIYAQDRQAKGFNTALLMTVQPDQHAEGPEERNTIGGFVRGFHDLSEGHLNLLNPEYFQYLDTIVEVLREHDIVPVFQPVFHGFGWKGKTVLGPTADPVEYARFTKYLIARYGAGRAMWLVSGDGTGRDRGVLPAGKMVEEWDAYQQPTGIHYNPADDFMPSWANGDSSKAFHYNKTHQAEPWLDFQWAQTGHDGLHIIHKVEKMYNNLPTKANLNGEPTYEGMNAGKNGLGWWQGHEAWSQLMHGGTMGVIYGAATLWQWKVSADEEGWDAWTDAPNDWKQALQYEGSSYVGYVGKILRNYNTTDIEKRWDLTQNNRPLLAKPGILYVSYLENGGSIRINKMVDGLPYRWINPKNGNVTKKSVTTKDQVFNAPSTEPSVLIIGKATADNS